MYVQKTVTCFYFTVRLYSCISPIVLQRGRVLRPASVLCVYKLGNCTRGSGNRMTTRSQQQYQTHRCREASSAFGEPLVYQQYEFIGVLKKRVPEFAILVWRHVKSYSRGCQNQHKNRLDVFSKNFQICIISRSILEK